MPRWSAAKLAQMADFVWRKNLYIKAELWSLA
jgi:hypothetical protein